MARTVDPLFGHLRGRIGNVVVYRMNGKMVVRSRPSGKRKPATGKLKQSQDVFRTVMAKMSAVRMLVNFGFDAVAVNRPAFHAAVSENLNRYRQVPDTDQRHWLLLSHGTRAQAADWSCGLSGNHLQVSWGDNQASGASHDSDRLVVFLVQKHGKEALLLPFVARRSDRQAFIDILPSYCNCGCDCFAAFYTCETMPKKHPSVISDSVWAGGW